MGDYLVRAFAQEVNLRATACISTEVTIEAARRHRALPVAAAALGYGLTAASLLGAQLRVQQRVAIKIEGNGPLGKMVTESDSYGRVRGYIAHPLVDAPPPIGRAAIAQAIGASGRLTVVKDLRVRDLYEGVVSLQTGEVDKDLMYYLFKSEQVPSLVEIGVEIDATGTVAAAGGVLIESMPDYDMAAFRSIAERLEDLPPLDRFFADGETPEQVLAHLFGPLPYEVLETRPVVFRCGCSRERSRQAVMLMGRDEIEALVLEGEAVVDCHFCHEQYIFDRDELRAMLAELNESVDSRLNDDQAE